MNCQDRKSISGGAPTTKGSSGNGPPRRTKSNPDFKGNPKAKEIYDRLSRERAAHALAKSEVASLHPRGHFSRVRIDRAVTRVRAPIMAR